MKLADIAQSWFLPEDFPVAIVEFTETGNIEYSTKAFKDLFFRNVSSDPFRSKADVSCVLPALSDGCPTGKVNKDDRRKFGRVDYFISWDDHSLSYDRIFKLGYPRFAGLQDGTREYTAAGDEPYKDERYFRFWKKERSKPGPNGEKVLIAAVIEVTKSEQQRREMKDVETRFAETLSGVLIDERLKEKDIFELRGRPRSGISRASGDFFVFWGMEKPYWGLEKPYKLFPRWAHRFVVAVIGDSSEKELLAAAAVQHAATILVPFCKSPPSKFFEVENPAKFLIEKFNAEFITTRIMGKDRIDGVILVFDLAKKLLHFAGGKPGGVLLVDRKTGNLETLTDDMGESFGPTIGEQVVNKFVAGTTNRLSEDTLIVAFTDGLRFRLAREIGAGQNNLSVKDRLNIVVKDTSETLGNPTLGVKSEGEEKADGTGVIGNLGLEQLVTRLSPDKASGERTDDELVVALSMEKLLQLEFS